MNRIDKAQTLLLLCYPASIGFKVRSVSQVTTSLVASLLKAWKLAMTLEYLKTPIIWVMKDQRILARQQKRIMVVRINFQASKCISLCNSVNHNVIEI
jgi:hypothetical protein